MQNYIFDGRGFAEHQSSLLWLVSENAHNSLPHGIFGLIYIKVVHPLVCKTVTKRFICFLSNFAYFLNIIKTQVCKTLTRLRQEMCRSE